MLTIRESNPGRGFSWPFHFINCVKVASQVSVQKKYVLSEVESLVTIRR